MADYTISKLKTGSWIGGSRVAILFAPIDAPAGSLSELTRFLNEQTDIRATPGYHGHNKRHVLRISGFEDDRKLLQLLREEFPKWQARHNLNDSSVSVAQNISVEPLKMVDHFPFEPKTIQQVKKNSNLLTGLSYLAGDVSLFVSGMRRQVSFGKHTSKDWLRSYASLSYLISHAALITLGGKADQTKDIYSILEETYPKLAQATDEEKRAILEQSDKTFNFIKHRPWEIYSAITATGSAAMIGSALQRKNYVEVPFMAVAFMAALITGLVPEKGDKKLIDLSHIFERQEGSVLESLEKAKQKHPSFAPLFNTTERLIEYIHNDPLKVSAGLSALGNIGLLGANQLVKGKTDAFSAGAAGAYLTGNYFQSHAQKARGPGFDTVASAAANIIYSDANLPKEDKEKLAERVNLLVEAMSQHKEIYHPKDQLKQAITERVNRKREANEPMEEVLAGFIPEEKEAMEHSPFVARGLASRMLAQRQQEPIMAKG